MRTMKLAAEDLSVGMFVAALDRPWLDSPFPFQGFPIKDLYELEQVRKHCRYVFVDVDRGLHADEHTPRRIPLAFKNARQGPPAGQSPTHPDVTENIGNMLRQPHFSRALPRVNRLRRRALIFMHRAIADLAKGNPINTPEANTILQELNEAVSINVNAALWLSLLRHEDEPAATHCVCTAVLALGFARYLGYQGEDLEAIGMGALLHDIGLAALSKEIRSTPGALDSRQLREMRRHPIVGYNLLCDIAGISPLTLRIIKEHHERMDGSGYPYGLQGDSIAREVALVAIADTYESMVGDRRYDSPKSPYSAISVIRRSRGTAFPSSMVDAIIRFLGIYPISTVVQLENRAIGMVIGHTPKTRLQPSLIMLFKPNGQPFKTLPILNLADEAEDDEYGAWQIVQVIEPEEYGIDPGKVTALFLDQALASS